MTINKAVEKVFSRQAGPRFMYGGVKLCGEFAKDFSVSSDARWPEEYDSKRYEESLRDGIVEAFEELGFDREIGRFRVLSVSFSSNAEANVPRAYREAAKLAALEIIVDGSWLQAFRNAEAKSGLLRK